MTIDDLLIELEDSEARFWSIQRSVIERKEGGTWHLHPFDAPETHRPTPEGAGGGVARLS